MRSPRSGRRMRRASRRSRPTRARERGGSFAALPPARQDALIDDLEQNRAPGFTPSSSAFFELVLGHTLEGTFGDPHYGGNQDFIGWELIGYPGLRLAVTAEQQRMDAALEPLQSSAYDHAQFDEHTTARRAR